MPAHQKTVLSQRAWISASRREYYLVNDPGTIDPNKREKVTTINRVALAHQKKGVWPAARHLVSHSCHDPGTRRN
jgi:hypothetical protein